MNMYYTSSKMQVDEGLKARVLRERKRVYVASLYPTVSFVD